MNVRNFFSLVGVASILSACAATATKLNVYDTQTVANAVSVQRDDFQKTVDYNGPNISQNFGSILKIRAWKFEKTSEIKYQIYVADQYDGDWRFYDTAYDSNGERLDSTLISRKVDRCSRYGCSHTEHIGLNITREYLEKNKNTGIQFKLSGKAGEAVFSIPGTYVQAILIAANEDSGQRTSNTNSRVATDTPKTGGTLKERFSEIEKQIRAVCALGELKEYYEKTACYAKEITLKQLTDETKVTPQQKPVILKSREMIDVLNKEMDSLLNGAGTDERRIAKIRNDRYSDVDNIHSDLYSGKISWGEFNRSRKDIGAQVDERIRTGK